MSMYTKTVDETNLTLTIERRFRAPRTVIWDYFTKQELLEQWWGPEGYPATVKSIDVRPGGRWHYYMTGPDGTKYWSLSEYQAIDPGRSFDYDDYFSDEQGGLSAELPATRVRVELVDEGAATLVMMTLRFKSLDDLRTLVEMGFEEGFASQCGRLDALLLAQAG